MILIINSTNEPKRTNPLDYNILVQEYKDKYWSFLEVSRKYIIGDCKALYQILIKLFYLSFIFSG
ncbi:hypothetical protein C1646_785866 [Rhizophagus diaphanus]|nr:hypothetical protein C1646_785866 [Rhizophagus diaphanus] [Rhizophagus sp. MUCL 43196]